MEEELKKENEELRSALRKFCSNTLCSQCPFNSDEWVCNLNKFIKEEE